MFSVKRQYNVEVGHINGREEDSLPANLFWTCRSCNVRCANTLRHAGIGRGLMGLESFRLLLNDSRFRAFPMILETPKGLDGGEELDAINLRVLQKLCGMAANPG